MAKYKVLQDITVYNYKMGNSSTGPVPTTIRYIIPAGTIIEAIPTYATVDPNFCLQNPTASPCQPGNQPFAIGNLQTKYGQTDKEIDTTNIQQVDDTTPVTLDANIIPKDISMIPTAQTNPNAKLITNGILIIVALIIILVFVQIAKTING